MFTSILISVVISALLTGGALYFLCKSWDEVIYDTDTTVERNFQSSNDRISSTNKKLSALVQAVRVFSDGAWKRLNHVQREVYALAEISGATAGKLNADIEQGFAWVESDIGSILERLVKLENQGKAEVDDNPFYDVVGHAQIAQSNPLIEAGVLDTLAVQAYQETVKPKRRTRSDKGKKRLPSVRGVRGKLVRAA